MLQWLAAAVLFSGFTAGADAQERMPPVGIGPEPSPVPISWEFDFQYVPPRRIVVQPAGAAKPQVYWYMLYTVTNTSDTTQYFYPTFELVTEDLRVIDTDVGISPLVFEAIRERHRITHKYLVPPTKAIGDLRTGADYARESVAIWRAEDISLAEFTIYVAGLSGEARVLRNPAYDPDQPETRIIVGADGREREVTVNPRYFTLRKTLQLRYTLPASEEARAQVEPRLEEARWIMR
jgi:hypothetical protein